MKSLKDFLHNFFKNKGQFVFVSLLISKITAFLSSLIIIRLLPENEFGILSIVATVFAVIIPFSGFGSQQSLLRYGSMSENLREKRELSEYLLYKGFGYQVLLSIIFLSVSLFYIKQYEDIFIIFIFFAVRLIGFFFFNHIQSELRVFGDNRKFAMVNNVVNIFGLILLFILTYFFSIIGYLIALAFTPFLALFWFRKEHFSSISRNPNLPKKEIFHYGLHASGTALLSDMLFAADVLLLSFFMNENAVANYKVAILIPANITFLALTFMQSDFPLLAKNYQNRAFLTHYILNYYKIFIPLALVIFLVGFIFKSEILLLFFSQKYADNTVLFIIFLAGFCCNMLLRNLYGNLLSAVGKMKINTIISVLTLLILFLLSGFFIIRFGELGMAISLSLTMFVNGLFLMFSFYHYIKNLK